MSLFLSFEFVMYIYALEYMLEVSDFLSDFHRGVIFDRLPCVLKETLGFKR